MLILFLLPNWYILYIDNQDNYRFSDVNIVYAIHSSTDDLYC